MTSMVILKEVSVAVIGVVHDKCLPTPLHVINFVKIIVK